MNARHPCVSATAIANLLRERLAELQPAHDEGLIREAASLAGPAVALDLGAAEPAADLSALASRLATEHGGHLPEQFVLTSYDAAHLRALAGELDKHISMKYADEEPQNKSRRSFIQTLCGLGLGASIGGTGMVASNDAKAYFEINNLPPGIQIIKDDALVQAYGSMLYRGYNEVQIHKILTQIGGDIKINTPLDEPGYWLVLNHYNYIYQAGKFTTLIDTEGNIKKFGIPINSPMYNWAKGINLYFRTWVASNKRYGSQIETEDYLLKSIFTAAGISEYDVENYKKLDLAGKEARLREVMEALEVKGDRWEKNQVSQKAGGQAAAQNKVVERAKLEKEIFILEKRLQREKLSYEKEYELTKQLQAAKGRLNGLNQPAQRQAAEAVVDRDWKDLLVAAWSSFWLVVHYSNIYRKSNNDEDKKIALMINNKVEIPLRKINKELEVRGDYGV